MRIRTLLNSAFILSSLLTSGCVILLADAFMPKISAEQRKINEERRKNQISILNEYLSKEIIFDEINNYNYKIMQTQNKINSDHVIDYHTKDSFLKELNDKSLYFTINRNIVFVYDIISSKLHEFNLDDLDGYPEKNFHPIKIEASDNMEDFFITYRKQIMDYRKYPQSVEKIDTNTLLNAKININKHSKVSYREIGGNFCENKQNCNTTSNSALLSAYNSDNIITKMDGKETRYVAIKEGDIYKYFKYSMEDNIFYNIMTTKIDPKQFKKGRCPSFIMREFDYISCTVTRNKNQKHSNVEVRINSFNGDVLSTFNTEKFIVWEEPTIVLNPNNRLILKGASSDNPKTITSILVRAEGDLNQNPYTLQEDNRNLLPYRGGEAEHLYSIRQNKNLFSVKDLDTRTGHITERSFTLFPLVENGMNLIFSISKDGKKFITDAYNTHIIEFN